MSRDFDARARQASANLRAAVEAADLTTTIPVAPVKRRPVVIAMRPALVVALLTIGSAVGVALVNNNPTPTPAPIPPATSTTTSTTIPSTTTSTVAASTTTTAAVVVAETTTTSTTEAPDVEPPALDITSPEDGSEVENKTVTFKGTTEPGARVFRGKFEAEVDSAGNWQLALIVSEGSNTVRFVARDAAGNEATAAVTVSYSQPTTTTTEKEKELAEFKAYATFGSCAETPPYDIYYGKGEPGSTVNITSEYGSGSTVVGEDGTWEKKVIFETAPENETFVVTVKDEFGRKKQFEMIHNP